MDLAKLGKHVLLDGYEADRLLLNDPIRLEKLLVESCQRAGASVLNIARHKFKPQGVTVLLMLAESHASIHTYPEHGAYCADVFTCGDVDPMPAADAVARALGGRVSLRLRHRGISAECRTRLTSTYCHV